MEEHRIAKLSAEQVRRLLRTRIATYDCVPAEQLGSGSFGTVYRLADSNGPLNEVLKVIDIGWNYGCMRQPYSEVAARVPPRFSPADAASPDFCAYVRRAEMELEAAQELGRLRSPFLMELLDGYSDNAASVVGHDRPVILLRMPLMHTLFELPAGYSEKTALRMGIDCCMGLSQIHNVHTGRQDGKTHRDVKPDNLFWGDEGGLHFVLGDYGLCRRYDPAADAPTQIITEGFASPELMSGLPYGPQTDLFSLGMTLYYYASGNNPEALHATVEARSLRLNGSRDAFPRPAGVSDALWAVLVRATEPRPEDRYRSAAEMCAALKAVQEGAAARDADAVQSLRAQQAAAQKQLAQAERALAQLKAQRLSQLEAGKSAAEQALAQANAAHEAALLEAQKSARLEAQKADRLAAEKDAAEQALAQARAELEAARLEAQRAAAAQADAAHEVPHSARRSLSEPIPEERAGRPAAGAPRQTSGARAGSRARQTMRIVLPRRLSTAAGLVGAALCAAPLLLYQRFPVLREAPLYFSLLNVLGIAALWLCLVLIDCSSTALCDSGCVRKWLLWSLFFALCAAVGYVIGVAAGAIIGIGLGAAIGDFGKFLASVKETQLFTPASLVRLLWVAFLTAFIEYDWSWQKRVRLARRDACKELDVPGSPDVFCLFVQRDRARYTICLFVLPLFAFAGALSAYWLFSQAPQ